jgi:VWFA-related protein
VELLVKAAMLAVRPEDFGQPIARPYGMTRRGIACLICLGAAAAQNPPFRVQSKVVQTPVSVIDKNGHSVDGLTAADFTVLDEGIPQQVTLDTFDTGVAHISLAIAIQSSRTSKLALAKIRRIGGMIQPIVTGLDGEAAVVTFDSEVNWLQDFTHDDEKIRSAMKSLKAAPAARARMFDALAEITDRMKPRKGRKVLLLISEGRDQGSEAKFQEVYDAVEREGIEVFGTRYSAYAMTWIAKSEDFPEKSDLDEMFYAQLFRLATTNQVRALALASGGLDYPFLRERGIEKVIEELGVEVHSQYILSFPQRENAPGMHRIEVTVPNRSDIRIRSRRAYWGD